MHDDNYVLTSSQGRYLAGADGGLRGAQQKGALIKRLSMRTRAELTADINGARKAIEAGEVQPKPYPPGAPDPDP